MIRLLKWIFLLAAVATFVVYIIVPEPIKTNWYILAFFLFSMMGWLSAYFFNRRAFVQVAWLFELLAYFLVELTKASLIVAHEVMTKKHYMEAGIIAVPLDTITDFELTIFSSLVSLTPGTMSVDFSADKSYLFVHAMYVYKGDSAVLASQLKSGFEQRVIRIFRN